MQQLLSEIRQCTACKDHLPLGPRPVLATSQQSKILIIGQAPGTKVHASGIPWDDQSGDRLRMWLGVDKATFYDPTHIAIVPMGFCYPGKGKSGDLPPCPECAPLWHEQLLTQMREVKLTLLIGQYAQKYYLRETSKKNLTETVHAFREYLPRYFPLPHPSPRNNIWRKKNRWFEEEVLLELRNKIDLILEKQV